MNTTYIPLRLHTQYSVAEGAIRIPDLAKNLAKRGIPACAMTDTNNLGGTYDFCAKLSKEGVQPIVGAQITMSHGKETFPLVFLARSQKGWENLVALTTQAAVLGEPAVPVLPLQELRGRTEGVFCLSAGIKGPIDTALLANDPELAFKRAKSLQALFPESFFLEISRMNTAEEARREEGLLALAKALHLPLVATNEAFFLEEDLYDAHDALLCVSNQTYLTVADRPRIPPQSWLKGQEQMEVLFADIPEALANTVAIAKKCLWSFEKVKPQLPRFPGLPEGETEEMHLRAESFAGLEYRLGMNPLFASRDVYETRLKYECDVITNMGFPGYFLIVSDFIRWAKSQNIPVGPGRGSGAGSLVAWCLLITDIDPLRYGLLFERFLNPNRVSMPDFDIDFCQERREEVIAYVRQRYGEERVAQIGTYGRMQAKAAVRDVGRVMQIPYPVVERWSSMIPNNPAAPITLSQALELAPLSDELPSADPSIKAMFDTALKLEGLYKNSSTHAAGVVIASNPVGAQVPLMRDNHGVLVTQFDMKASEEAGLVKFDFLGLKTLDAIQGTLDLLKPLGIEVDFNTVGVEDEDTYKMLAAGESFSVFQLESAGMRQAVRQIQPTTIEDIVALGALYRPGPMENIPTYARVKHGEEEASYLHPSMEPVLQETYGIIVYQEQVMEVARKLAGYTLGQADLLRRAMGKKIKAEMDAQRLVFEKGAAENGIDPSTAVAIFDLLEKFANYGFNKSHAAAYGVLSFQTAYLKCHYPAAFFAAAMDLDRGQVDKLAEFHREARESGIPILPPDVNASCARFTLEQQKKGGLAIRWALGAVRGVGIDAIQRLEQDRAENGRFTSIENLVKRGLPLGLNKKMLESLAKSGALDGLSAHRGAALDLAEKALRQGQSQQKAASVGQGSLLGLLGVSSSAQSTVPNLDRDEILDNELKTLGLFFSGHPLDKRELQNTLKRTTNYRLLSYLMNTENYIERKDHTIAALLMKIQFKTSRSKKSMAILRISDPTSLMEVMLFDEDVANYKDLLKVGNALKMTVSVSERDGERRLFIRHLEPIETQSIVQAQQHPLSQIRA